MHKWIGIRVSAILTILGSAMALLLAGSMVWAGFHAPPPEAAPESPFPIKALMVVMAALFIGFSAWGIATAIGIFRHRGWARLSIIVFACLLVGMGGSALVGILFIHMPETPNVSVQTMQNVRIGIAAFYGSLTVLGAWWLLLFNASATKQYFAEQPPAPGARPLSISVIGWYLLVCSLGTAVGAILRMPGMFFGLVLTGWASLAIYTAFTAVQIYLGTGLLQMQEPARVATIVYFALLGISSAVTCMLPGFGAKMQMVQQGLPTFLRAGQPPANFEGTGAMMLMGTLIMAIPVWFLVRRRGAFRG
jgi:hypothetical protein